MAGEPPPGEDQPEGGWLPPEPAGPEPDLSEDRATGEEHTTREQTTTQGFAPPAGAQPTAQAHQAQPGPAAGASPSPAPQAPSTQPPPPGYGQPPSPPPSGYAPPPPVQPPYGYPSPPGYPPQAAYAPPPGQPPPAPAYAHQGYPPAQQQLGWGQPPPGYQQQPGWHQPPPGYVQPTSVPTNGAAVAGFVLSVSAAGLMVTSFGFLWPLTLIGAILGVVYSRKGKRAVAERRTDKHGQLAQAGFVIGIVALVLSVLAIAGCAALIADPDFRDSFDDGNNNSGGFESVVLVTRLLAGALRL